VNAFNLIQLRSGCVGWNGYSTLEYEGISLTGRPAHHRVELTTLEAARRLAMSDKDSRELNVLARHGHLGESSCLVTDLEAEVARLKRELVEARMERDILKNHRVLCQGIAVRYVLITTLRAQYSCR